MAHKLRACQFEHPVVRDAAVEQNSDHFRSRMGSVKREKPSRERVAP